MKIFMLAEAVENCELKAVITPRVETDNQQLLLRIVDQGLGIAVTSQNALFMSSARKSPA